MELREFKVKQIVKLREVEEVLINKYPEKRERVRNIVDILVAKLSNLRAYTLYDYLETIYLASREFPEFKELIPSTSEVEELLEGDE